VGKWLDGKKYRLCAGNCKEFEPRLI
jgi:hypothetical protein